MSKKKNPPQRIRDSEITFEDGCPKSIEEIRVLQESLKSPQSKKTRKPSKQKRMTNDQRKLLMLRRRRREVSERDRITTRPTKDNGCGLTIDQIIAQLAENGLISLSMDQRGRLVASFDREASPLSEGLLVEFARNLEEFLSDYSPDSCNQCQPSIIPEIDHHIRCQRCEARLRKKRRKKTD